MSRTDFERYPFGDAMAIEADAAAWVRRRYLWDWSHQDQAELDAWLGELFEHQVAYIRLEAAWNRAERLVALQPHSRRIFGWPHRPLAGVLLKIAATVAVVSVLGIATAFYISTPRSTTYATTVGGHETLALNDGSRIELNTDTVVRVSNRSDVRQIWLDKGEAYFDVIHDARRPFTVFAGDGRIVDIGTKFVARRELGHLRVAVVQGAARVDDLGGQTQQSFAILTSGDVAIATATSVSVTRKSTSELAAGLSWRRGVLVFNNTPLDEVASEFNRYNRTKLIIADPATGMIQIGGTFAIDNVEGFTRIAQRLLKLHVQERDGEILISR